MIFLLFVFLQAHADTQSYHVGEKVTCIYEGIFSWSSGEEFIKTFPVQCKVLEVVDGAEGPIDQQIKVDCTEGLKDHWDNGPGTGLVKNQEHGLNQTKLWYYGDKCLHWTP